MSGHRCSFTRSSTSPGSIRRWAEARSTLRVADITSAAGTPLSVTSPTTKPDPPVGKRDHVVEVAAHLACGAVAGRDLPAGQIGKLLGQEVLLDQPGDLELLLEALARGGLRLLLAHELGDPQRRRRLAGEVVEQLAVVGGVVLLREARSEVEHPDQLALADERDGELHARGLELAQRGRVELERVDVDGLARALEVGEQRVVRRDLDRWLPARAARPPRRAPARRRRRAHLPRGRAFAVCVETISSARSSRFLSTQTASGKRYGIPGRAP